MSKKKIIFPLIIIFIMVASTFGVIFSSFTSNNQESIRYKGHRFTYDGSIWFTYKDKQRIEFLIDPRELESVNIGNLVQKLLTHEKIYLSAVPSEAIDRERQFFKQTISQLFQVPVINSCPAEDELCSDLPIKNCQDAIQNQILVIKLEKGNNEIQENESCITILGSSEYIIKILDKLRYERLL